MRIVAAFLLAMLQSCAGDGEFLAYYRGSVGAECRVVEGNDFVFEVYHLRNSALSPTKGSGYRALVAIPEALAQVGKPVPFDTPGVTAVYCPFINSKMGAAQPLRGEIELKKAEDNGFLARILLGELERVADPQEFLPFTEGRNPE